MLIFKSKLILSVFLVIEGIKSKSDISRILFYKISGKISSALSIKQTKDLSLEDCMAVCLDDERCKSFTAYLGTATSPHRCLFYAQDVCNSKVKLLPNPSTDYFGTSVNGRCPNSE